MKNELIKTNNSLRKKNGLYVASSGEHYNAYVWIRDVYYQARPNLGHDKKAYEQTYHSLLDYLINMEEKYGKLSWIIKNGRKNVNSNHFVHPRFYSNLEQITPDWGNVQIDTIGYLLLGIAEGMKQGYNMLRDSKDELTINMIIAITDAIDYHTCPDNGIWEEWVEVHASSVGAVLGGLKAIKETGFDVPEKLIRNGKKAINSMFPRESVSKSVDLALMTLIWPFNVLTKKQSRTIIENCISDLERENGFIRYVGDIYYNLANHSDAIRYGRLTNHGLDNYVGNEAEWCFGFTFAALSFSQLKLKSLAKKYLEKAKSVVTNDYKVPELYYSKTNVPNDNTPLGWATAMLLVAIMEIENQR